MGAPLWSCSPRRSAPAGPGPGPGPPRWGRLEAISAEAVRSELLRLVRRAPDTPRRAQLRQVQRTGSRSCPGPAAHSFAPRRRGTPGRPRSRGGVGEAGGAPGAPPTCRSLVSQAGSRGRQAGRHRHAPTTHPASCRELRGQQEVPGPRPPGPEVPPRGRKCLRGPTCSSGSPRRASMSHAGKPTGSPAFLGLGVE